MNAPEQNEPFSKTRRNLTDLAWSMGGGIVPHGSMLEPPSPGQVLPPEVVVEDEGRGNIEA